MRKYFTATVEHPHTRTLVIGSSDKLENFIEDFYYIFQFVPGTTTEFREGLDIPEIYVPMLTEEARKTIARIRGNSENSPPDFFYVNIIHIAV